MATSGVEISFWPHLLNSNLIRNRFLEKNWKWKIFRFQVYILDKAKCLLSASLNGEVEKFKTPYTIMQFNFRHFKILQLEKLALFNLAYFCHPPIKPKFPSRQYVFCRKGVKGRSNVICPTSWFIGEWFEKFRMVQHRKYITILNINE